jgi:hypothetical protein
MFEVPGIYQTKFNFYRNTIMVSAKSSDNKWLLMELDFESGQSFASSDEGAVRFALFFLMSSVILL